LLAIAILAILLGLFFVLISIPVDFIFRFDSFRSPSFRFQMGWFFSLVKIKIGEKKKKPPKPKKPKKKKAKKKKKGKSNIQLARLITRSLLFRVLRLVRDVLGSFNLMHIDADLEAGLGEPADTGMVFGAVWPLLALMPVSLRQQIRLSPNFGTEPVLAGTANGDIRIRPILIIFVILRFIFSGPVLRTIKNIIVIKWRNRN